jgi:hypothetical protein
LGNDTRILRDGALVLRRVQRPDRPSIVKTFYAAILR